MEKFGVWVVSDRSKIRLTAFGKQIAIMLAEATGLLGLALTKFKVRFGIMLMMVPEGGVGVHCFGFMIWRFGFGGYVGSVGDRGLDCVYHEV